MASATPSSFQGSPPIPRTRLIGREHERAQARAFLIEEAVPLLTLTGPGGVGKTRLALAIAQDVEAHFADGVIWVDLAPVADPALVPSAVARAIGLGPAGEAPLLGQMARILRPRQTLLLIDNCEHVLEGIASLVSSLLVQCPAMQVLATSRAPLRLRGEQTLRTAPLQLPDAEGAPLSRIAENESVMLFVERARAAQSAFALTESNAPVVARLCHRLDGLPLAIELAASRIAVFSPEALEASLRGKARLPGSSPRDLPARQHTIEATIAWSYALLDKKTQTLFRRLAVFLGGFSLEAAQGVRPPDQSTEDAIAAISSLVEQSLVYPVKGAAEPRFTMLETIRAFALERLDEAGERDAANDAHAAVFVGWSRRGSPLYPMDAEPYDATRSRANLEQANIRAALGHLMAREDPEGVLLLAGVFSLNVRLNPREGRTWIEWALANAANTPTAPRGFALAELAFFLWSQAQHEQAIPLAEASLVIAEQLGDNEVRANALDVLGNIALSQHHYARAQSLLLEVIGLWRPFGERTREASALQLLAGAEHGLGDDEAATRHVLQALAIYRALRNPVGASTTLARLGRQLRDQGNDRDAALAFHEALELGADGADRFILVQSYAGLAELASRRGQPEIAAALIGAIDAVARDMGATRLPTAGVNYDRATAAACEALGAERFEALREAGGTLRLGDAVALARLVDIPTASPGGPDPAWSQLARVRSTVHADAASPDEPADTFARIVARPSTSEAAVSLTYREQDVLALLAQRLTDHEIAERLFISRKTASNHVSNILAKLGAANRREATAIAARLELV